MTTTGEKGMEETGSGEPRSGRRQTMIAIGSVLLLAAAVWGVRAWRFASVHESTDDAFVGGHLVPVIAKVGGFVAEVGVAENQHVAEGDAVVSLDESELRQRVAQAEAEVAAARAAIGSSGEGRVSSRVQQAEGQRESLDAQITAARANAERADKDLERIRGLADKEIVSRQQLDLAAATVTAMHAAVTSLERQRMSANAGVTTVEGNVKESEARLKVAEAALAGAQLQLSYAQIKAPATGTVAKKSVEPGQLLQPGQPLFTIVADSGTFVSANFKETQVSDIQVGAAATIDVDAYGGCEAKGEVQGIGGATGSQFALIPSDNATGNFTKVVQRVPVRIRLTEGCGSEQPLRPGMSVVVHVSTN